MNEMTPESILDIPLKASYNVVSDTYKGSGLDIHQVCEEMRQKTQFLRGTLLNSLVSPPTLG